MVPGIGAMVPGIGAMVPGIGAMVRAMVPGIGAMVPGIGAMEQWCQASEQKKAYNDVRYGNKKVSIRIKYGLDLQKFG